MVAPRSGKGAARGPSKPGIGKGASRSPAKSGSVGKGAARGPAKPSVGKGASRSPAKPKPPKPPLLGGKQTPPNKAKPPLTKNPVLAAAAAGLPLPPRQRQNGGRPVPKGARAAGQRYAAQAPPSTRAKGTGGLPVETAYSVAGWGGWSVPRKVTPDKRVAGRRARRASM